MSKKDGNGALSEENNALMANGRAKPEDSNFATFLYNKREGKLLGRTAKSWAQITIFYIIFYTLLAAFWLACLHVFLSTIDPELPRYYGKGTIIGANPGVGYQPWLKEEPESTLIKFNTQDRDSYSHYVEALDKYLAKYENDNNTKECAGDKGNKDIVDDGKVKEGSDAQACRFDLKPFEKEGCSKANDYGFRDGQPCVIVSLNRLIGWTPVDYSDNEVPEPVEGRYQKGSIAFTCGGIYDPDKEYLGNVTYIPEEGIDGRFYPYAVMENYHQPIAMVKFTSLPKNRLVMVECRAYAKNIVQDTESKQGMVIFEILREDFEPKKEKDD
ncbi:CRE-NKB-3 protein [Aphelenchoides avenae]|nr:CRE-NKB-3 protein [Aphelenchus avenae]